MTPAEIERAYRQHAVSLTRYATTLVGPDEAADIVADAVTSTLKRNTMIDVDDIGNYWFRAITNIAASSHRSRFRRVQRELKSVSGQSPSTGIDTSDDARELLGGLSAQQRAVVFLTYWQDLTPAEVARVLGVSEGSVRKQLARARQQLRKDLHDDRAR